MGVPRPRILLAVAKDSVERMLRVLEGYEVIVALQLPEAERLLDESDFRVVIVGAHFDESRMFDLLQAVRDHPRCARVLIVGVLVLKGKIMRRTMLPTLEHAARELGAHAFINVAGLPDDAAGNAQVRNIIDELIARPRG